jgi:hypothetical protein
MLTKSQLAEKLNDLAAKVDTARDYLANEADLEDTEDRNMVINYVVGIGYDVDRIVEEMVPPEL